MLSFVSVAFLLIVADAAVTKNSIKAGTCVCTTTTVNARSTGSTSGSVIRVINSGECLKFHGGQLTNNGYVWFQLDDGGKTVWVAGKYLNKGSCSGSTGGGSGNYLTHGDVRHIQTNGASARTARQDGLSGGVSSSHTMVSSDYSTLNAKKNCYYEAGKNNGLQPSLIAAIASRESRGGSILKRTGGYGDGGHAYGILQCDGGASGWGSKCKKYKWDSCAHMNMMMHDMFVPYINQIARKHSSWTKDMDLKGAVAAYNSGVGNVVTYAGMDRGTTGNDYSDDVIARAQYLISHYHWD